MHASLIRSATTSDMAAVTSIYEHFVLTSTATFELTPPDLPEMLRRHQAVLDRGLPYLVAELEGYIVGYGYASQFRPREAYRFTVEDSIYVRADCIGYGVGRKLLTALIAGCELAGCHRMVACIGGENPASVALHLSRGFAPVGILPEAGFKFGKWIDMTMMQRPLVVKTAENSEELAMQSDTQELQQV
jgi:L-amino acid N-acyltransferase YncA